MMYVELFMAGFVIYVTGYVVGASARIKQCRGFFRDGVNYGIVRSWFEGYLHGRLGVCLYCDAKNVRHVPAMIGCEHEKAEVLARMYPDEQKES